MMLRYKQTRSPTTRFAEQQASLAPSYLPPGSLIPLSSSRRPKRDSLSSRALGDDDAVSLKMRAYHGRGGRNGRNNGTTAIRQQAALVPTSVLTESPFLFPIDNIMSSDDDEDDDDRSMDSGITFSTTATAPVLLFSKGKGRCPAAVSPTGSAYAGDALGTPVVAANTTKPSSGLSACKRVSFSSIHSAASGTTAGESDDDDQQARKVGGDPPGALYLPVQTPITDAACALVFMMNSHTNYYSRMAGPASQAISEQDVSVFDGPTAHFSPNAGGDSDEEDNDILSAGQKKKAATKKSRKSIPKKGKKTIINRRGSSSAAAGGSRCGGGDGTSPSTTPGASFRRIPRRFIDDPTLPTLKRGMRLAMPNDRQELNSLHCFVRSELLEVFVLDVEQHPPEGAATPASGHRVGVRCVHCGKLPKSERAGTSMSTFFPKSLQDIYRGVCTWQRIHFKACRHMPDEFNDLYWKLKDTDRSRGKKSHWVKSAHAMGFRNVDDDRSGVIYCPVVGGDSDDAVVTEDCDEEDAESQTMMEYTPVSPDGDDDSDEDAKSQTMECNPVSPDGDDSNDSDDMADYDPAMTDSFDDARSRYYDYSSDIEEVEI